MISKHYKDEMVVHLRNRGLTKEEALNIIWACENEQACIDSLRERRMIAEKNQTTEKEFRSILEVRTTRVFIAAGVRPLKVKQ